MLADLAVVSEANVVADCSNRLIARDVAQTLRLFKFKTVCARLPISAAALSASVCVIELQERGQSARAVLAHGSDAVRGD